MTTPSRQLAKDVASELDMRRRRRKLFFFLLWAAVIIAAILWLRCGRGWGTGGKGPGEGPGTGVTTTTTEGPKRCVVRVSSEGITVDGKKQTKDEAVALCKKTEGALITVTGSARQGDWDDLRTALEGAGVQIFKRN
jgi:hypothetical protein